MNGRRLLLIGAGIVVLGTALYFAWKVRQPLSYDELCEQRLAQGGSCEYRLYLPTDRL